MKEINDIIPFDGEELPVSAGLSGLALKTQTPYQTALAVAKPRNLDQVVKEVLREAEFAGEAFFYSWPVKNNKTGEETIIEGPSIGLALAIARAWGNCAIPVDYHETSNEWVFNAHFIDLETGYNVCRIYRKRKATNLSSWGERSEDMAFQAAQSKAIRNAILAGIPRWLVNMAMEKAKQAVINHINKEGLEKASKKAVEFLARYGITEERMVAALKVPRSQWTSSEIAVLRSMAQQIRDGLAAPEDLFPPVEVAEEERIKRRGRPKKDEPGAPEVRKPAPDQPKPVPDPSPLTTSAENLITPEQGREIEAMISLPLVQERLGMSATEIEREICQWHEVKGVELLTQDQAVEVLNWLRKTTEQTKNGNIE